MAKKAQLRIGIEAVLAITVLVLLYMQFGGGLKDKEMPVDDNSEVTQNEDGTTNVNPNNNGKSEIQMTLENSGRGQEDLVRQFPSELDSIPFYDASKFTEAEVIEFGAGTEYFVTFIYEGETNFDQFADYYMGIAADNGYEIVNNIYGVNGTKTVLTKDDTEIRAVTFIQQDTEGNIFIKEKTRVFILSK